MCDEIGREDPADFGIDRPAALRMGAVGKGHPHLPVREEIAKSNRTCPKLWSRSPTSSSWKTRGGAPAAFMGIGEQKLEMLFLSPEARGRGHGKRLLQYGIERYAVQEVTVNEQNPQAIGFYEHMGFQTLPAHGAG